MDNDIDPISNDYNNVEVNIYLNSTDLSKLDYARNILTFNFKGVIVMKLWLDSKRQPPDGWIWCQSLTDIQSEMLKFTFNGLVDLSITHISLGYNLGFGNGEDVAKWLTYEAIKWHN